MSRLIGTAKQVEYAEQIIDDLRRKYVRCVLPTVCDSSFWIKHRDSTFDEILAASKDLNTPFTEYWPKFDRAIAVDTIRQLERNLKNILIVDLETDGLGKQHEMISFTAIELVKGKTIYKPSVVFDTFIQPEHIDKFEGSKAASVNKITINQLKHAPTLPEIWDEIEPLLHKHIVTFNTFFDIPMIRRSARRYQLPVPSMRSTCLMKTVTTYFESPDYLNLDELLAYTNIRLAPSLRHTAMGDAFATAQALAKLFKLVVMEDE